MMWTHPLMAYVLIALIGLGAYIQFDLSVPQACVVMAAAMFARREP